MNAVKKMLSVVLAFTFFLSVAVVGFSGEAKASDPNVQLAYANTSIDYSGGSSVYSLTGGVEVKNLAYTKQVSVAYTTGNGQWNEQPASYAASNGNGYETWTFNIVAPASSAFEFSFKYVVNGQTYWDNNGGSNYKVGGTGQPDRILGTSALQLSEKHYYSNRSGLYIYGKVYLKNLAPTKTVNVVYSYDNWATTQTATATYDSAVAGSNNAFENWTFSFTANGQPVQFAISYTVNGVTYWDNNHGANYSLHFN
ncbi:hypothetical protein [Paenibacillus sp. SI8]|uniref:hypothetical protein n=1 Tax=unclassified Paenibacillus TaxID=185978 RepID=UPI0034675F0D